VDSAASVYTCGRSEARRASGRRRNAHRIERWQLTVEGVVQGVGFRPFVYRLATSLGLCGWVKNTPSGVVIQVEGEGTSAREFMIRLEAEAPPVARILKVGRQKLEPSGAVQTDSDGLPDHRFQILESGTATATRPCIPPDVAMCRSCGLEVLDPKDRRHGYPFTNCTDCGPRFTITKSLPYDRPDTTMSQFIMCAACSKEYHDPLNRRFHAQPNACPACGPRLFADGEPIEARAGIALAAQWLAQGKIVALKGLAGFHLACDARNSEAVESLRTRKRRSLKPFALMARDIEEIKRVAVVGELEERLLQSAEAPIVLMKPRDAKQELAAGIAPSSRYIGIMLPYTPLHHLLLSRSPSMARRLGRRHGGPHGLAMLVMTSGNLAEEPICHTDEEARQRLGGIADHFLTHDRPIHMACDDSVVLPVRERAIPIRRSRGYVPAPIGIGFRAPAVLGMGAQLNHTFCLLEGEQAVISQHVGDLENTETLDYFERALHHLRSLLRFEPRLVAHDLHPDYLSTRLARRKSGGLALKMDGAEREGVQHHHAHIASVLADNQERGPVIGVAFDGTGYGTDGAVWGGEFLVCDLAQFRRAAHLAYIPLPGGEAAIRRPARMAFAYLLEACGDFEAALGLVPGLKRQEAAVVARQIERKLNSPPTSSMGRLFDAASVILGGPANATYEGEAACWLEAQAASWPSVEPPYDFTFHRESGEPPGPGFAQGLIVDVMPAVRELVSEILRGFPREQAAARFHSTVAELVASTCQILRDEGAPNKVALSGGCFQNALLTELCLDALERLGFEVAWHRHVPPNDGGISLGQAVVAAARRQRRCEI
jgi:hydrogenase maturation protein HypF